MDYTNLVRNQVAPIANTSTAIYTVASENSIKFGINVCNRSGKPTNFSIAIRENGATLEDKHYVCFGEAILGNSSLIKGEFIANETDIIEVLCNDENVTFTIFGETINTSVV